MAGDYGYVKLVSCMTKKRAYEKEKNAVCKCIE